MILFICGKSGSGKDTLARHLLDMYDIYSKLPIYTTRPKREGEIDGREYIFLSEHDFVKKSYDNEFIEDRVYHTSFGVWRYATGHPKEDGIYLLYGPIGMLKDVCSRIGSADIFKVYIDVSAKERLDRALSRISNEQGVVECCRRVYQDDIDFKDIDMNMFDLVLSNSNKDSIEDNVRIINQRFTERCRLIS